MTSRIAAAALLGFCLMPLLSFAAPQATDRELDSHRAWVMQSLERMERIKPGMTRADLMQLFTTEGGIQNGMTFVFRDCPYFKVTVEWDPPEPRGPRPRNIEEAIARVEGKPTDVIKSISRPYIQKMIID